MARQWKIKPTQPVVSQIDKGRENQRNKSEKQFIMRAASPPENFMCRFVDTLERTFSVAITFLSRHLAGTNSRALKVLVLSCMACNSACQVVQTEHDLKNSVCFGGGLSLSPAAHSIQETSTSVLSQKFFT
jgi:hypothetical protein